MMSDTRKLRALLEEAYRNQSYLESVPPSQRTKSWGAELYKEHTEYVELLRNTYYRLCEHTETPTIYLVK
jgi:hypothetical protein